MRKLGGFILFLVIVGGLLDAYNSMPVAESLSNDIIGLVAWMGRFVFLVGAAILGGASFVVKDKHLARLCFWTGLIAAIISGVISAVSPMTQAKNAELYHGAVNSYVRNIEQSSKADDAIFNALLSQNRITNHPTLNAASFRDAKISAAREQFEASKQLKINQADIFGSTYAAYAIYFGIGLVVSLTLFAGSAIGFNLLSTPVQPTAKPSNHAISMAVAPTRSTVTDEEILDALEKAVRSKAVQNASVGSVKKAVAKFTNGTIGTDRAKEHRHALHVLLNGGKQLKAVK